MGNEISFHKKWLVFYDANGIFDRYWNWIIWSILDLDRRRALVVVIGLRVSAKAKQQNDSNKSKSYVSPQQT
jgi:hypothetical protein